MPELWKRTFSTDGIRDLNGLGPAQFLVGAGPQMGAPGNLLGHGGGDSRVGMAQQQGAMPGNIVNKLVAVHIPLVGADAVGQIQGKGLGIAVIVGNAAGKNLGRRRVPLGRAGMLGNVFLEDGRHNLSLRQPIYPLSYTIRQGIETGGF